MADFIAGTVTWKLDIDDSKFKQQLTAASAQVKSLASMFSGVDKTGSKALDSLSKGSSVADAALGKVNSTSAQTSAILARVRSTADGALDKFSDSTNRAADSLVGLVGQGAKFVALGLGAAFTAATVTGFKFNSAIEQAETKIQAFTKSADRTADILAFVRKEAANTQFSFSEMADAAANLIPPANSGGIALEKLIRQAEVLAALNPAEGLVGAAFSLREALSGDFVSIVERFNLPRQRLNQLKDEGVPAIDAINRALAEMGVDFDLVTKQGQTTAARLDQVKDRFTILAGAVSQPFFDTVSVSLEKLQASSRWGEVQERLVDLSTAAAGSVNNIIKAFETRGLSAALDTFGDEIGKLRLGEKLTSAFESIDFKPILSRLITGFIGALQSLPVGQVSEQLSSLFFRFFSAIDFVDVTANLVGLLVRIIPDIIDGLISGFIDVALNNPLDLLQLFLALGLAPLKLVKVVGELLGRIPIAGSFFKWLFDAFSSVAQNILTPIRELLGKVINAAIKPFEKIGGTLFNAGKDLVQGLLDGAGSLLSKIGQFFLDKLPGFIKEPFKRALGIKSPSKVFATYGENITEGLVGGLNGSRSMIDDAMSSLSTDIAKPVFAPNVFAEETSELQGRSGTVVNQTNNIYNQIDLDRGLRDLAWQLGN
jgi:hypothetical protein